MLVRGDLRLSCAVRWPGPLRLAGLPGLAWVRLWECVGATATAGTATLRTKAKPAIRLASNEMKDELRIDSGEICEVRGET
jgi:hypothetical protein